MSTPDVASAELEEQRREIVALAREFAEREIAPYAAEWDRAKALPADMNTKLAELGFFGMRIPEAFDGLGLDSLTYLMVLEALAGADASVTIGLSVHNSLAARMIVKHGSDEQKQRWLPVLARGEVIGAFALSEADAGSDAAALRTQATRDGDEWVLNGTKAWVTNGGIAGLYVLMARTEMPDPRQAEGAGATSRTHGISAFLIPGEASGLEVGKAEDKTGLCASRTTSLVLRDVRVPAAALLGQRGRGLSYALGMLDQGRLGVGAQAVGIAGAALEHALKYSAERQQFGRPIRDFQAIQFKLADMATRLAAARALLYETAAEADDLERLSTRASMTKLFASETAMWITTQAVQIFGGYGYMRDYPVERLFRDAKVTEIYEGTNEVQRIVIARGLAG